MAPKVTIDEYSLAALPIETLFNDTSLSVGTAFVWSQDEKHFLITNWHNVSGKDPRTGRHLSKTAAEPNKLRVWFNQKNELGSKIERIISIRDGAGNPLWFVHPIHGNSIDVVALVLTKDPEIEPFPINRMSTTDLLIQVGMDVFILGFPFGIGPGGLPIWKRGSIASEPQLAPREQLHIFVDTASRPGMSGSPVIRRSWGFHMMSGNNVSMGTGTATKFVGIYSGRLTSSDPLDAQLGFTWPAFYVPEIVAAAKVDS